MSKSNLDIFESEQLSESVVNVFLRSIVAKANKTSKSYAHLSSHFLEYLQRNEANKVMKDGPLRFLDVVFCPVNISSTHWILIVVYPKTGDIKSYDSMDSEPSANSEYRKQFASFMEKEYETYTIKTSSNVQSPTQTPGSSKLVR